MNNPGKYERYKPFTGLDEPVIRFLEEDGEIAVFLEHVYALVDASVNGIWNAVSPACPYVSAVQAVSTVPYIRHSILPST